jgi:sugar/nucleoside kinase (ribokinase family)
VARIFVFGSAAWDIVLQVDEVPSAGSQVEGDLLGWRAGGSSANIACALSSAGHEVQFVGPIGLDRMGEALVAELRRRGVATDYAVRLPAASPRTLILLDARAERTIVNLAARDWPTRLALPDMPALAAADCLYIEGYARYPVQLARFAPSALIAVPPPDSLRTVGPADLVVGSRAQLPQAWAAAPLVAARSALGPRLRWVVVTDGDRGAVAYHGDGSCRMAAVPARPVDRTGAGDSFVAGLLHGLLGGWELQEAMRLAVIWGAAAVERLQSIPPSWEDVMGSVAADGRDRLPGTAEQAGG